EEARPRPKSGGGSNKLIIGGAIAAVGVILVGVVVFFLMNSGDDSAPKSTPAPSGPRADSGPGQVPGSGAPDTPAPKPDTPATAGAGTANDLTFTNLLPNDTEQVVTVVIKDLLKTPVGRAIFEPTGMLRPAAFQQKMGFPIDEVERVVLASNFTNNWTFNIV